MKERRRERLATFVKKELPQFFSSELELPEGSFVSVLYVEIVESGSKANVFVSAFPDEKRQGIAKTLKMSENKATHFMRECLKSKYSPVIRFLLVENNSGLESGAV